jgi:hypothetical protein
MQDEDCDQRHVASGARHWNAGFACFGSLSENHEFEFAYRESSTVNRKNDGRTSLVKTQLGI